MRLLVAAAALALSGCVSTAGTLDSAQDRTRLNARAAQQTATVTLVSGETFRARGFRVDADEASWTDPGTGQLVVFDRTDVARVRFIRRGQGMLDGAALGAGTGFVAGAGAVLTACGAPYPNEAFPFPDPCASPRLVNAAITGAVTGVLGGIVGAVASPAAGRKQVWKGSARRRP